MIFHPDDVLLSCTSNLPSIHIYDMTSFLDQPEENQEEDKNQALVDKAKSTNSFRAPMRKISNQKSKLINKA